MAKEAVPEDPVLKEEKKYADIDEVFVGGNPKERTLPGKAPGEIVYCKVDDGTGRMVSDKPANAPYLSYAKYKAEQAALQVRRDNGEYIAEDHYQWSITNTLWFIGSMLGLACLLGNFVVGSPVWGYEKEIGRQFQRVFPRTMMEFTPKELSAYDGTNSGSPLYIGLDGEVWDVSTSRRMYGPGGSYHVMAGRDAARAFVTGCFSDPDHLTPDLRGFGAEELQTLENWKSFFRNHEKYRKVGHVKKLPIPASKPIPKSCTPGEGGGEKGDLSSPALAPQPQAKAGHTGRKEGRGLASSDKLKEIVEEKRKEGHHEGKAKSGEGGGLASSEKLKEIVEEKRKEGHQPGKTKTDAEKPVPEQAVKAEL